MSSQLYILVREIQELLVSLLLSLLILSKEVLGYKIVKITLPHGAGKQ